MCASRWLTPIRGISRRAASDLAAATPTTRDPMRPGPRVTAMASRSQKVTSAWRSTSANAGLIAWTCALDASSGTIPPYRSCRADCEETTLARIVRSPRSTAAEVSSQEVSMARTRVSGELGTVSLRRGSVAGSRPAVVSSSSSTSGSANETSGTDRVLGAGPEVWVPRGERRACAGMVVAAATPRRRPKAVADLPVPREVDALHPHANGILAGLDVVASPNPHRAEAEPFVHPLRPQVGLANLERHRPGPPGRGCVDEAEHELGPHVVAVPGRVDGDRRDVSLRGRQ